MLNSTFGIRKSHVLFRKITNVYIQFNYGFNTLICYLIIIINSIIIKHNNVILSKYTSFKNKNIEYNIVLRKTYNLLDSSNRQKLKKKVYSEKVLKYVISFY